MSTAKGSYCGFLLSRQWRDHVPAQDERGFQQESGLQLVYWLKTKSEVLKLVFNQQEAVFFVSNADVPKAEAILRSEAVMRRYSWRRRELALKSFDHQAVSGFYFTQQRGLYSARELLMDKGIELFEADVRPVDRFLMERFITGGIRVIGHSKQFSSYREMLNPKVEAEQFSPTLKVLSLDIETSMSGNKLYSIAAYVDTYYSEYQQDGPPRPGLSRVFMLGNDSQLADSSGFSNGFSNGFSSDIVTFCVNERALLQQFLAWFHEVDPDIIIGWNVINFDLRFLQKKSQALGLGLDLGRGQEELIWRQSREDRHFYTLVIPGRAVLDGIDTLKSATYNFESFSLQYVSSTLLGRGKLIDDVDNRGEKITQLFHQDKIALAKYNLEDCRLVWDIFCATQLISFALERAALTGLAVDRFGGSVAAFDHRYLPLLHRKGFVAPQLKENPQGVGSPGGYVMDSRPGLYRNVLVLDFKSLYPSIIRTFMIDPLGLALATFNTSESDASVDEALGDNVIPGFNGAFFQRKDSILPSLISELWRVRDRAKSEKNQAMSQAIKILMNSFYGVLGTPGCRFFDARLPSSITLRGHEILTKTKAIAEENGYEVIYGDTDSIFIWLKNMSHTADAKALFATGRKLAEDLNRWWQRELQTRFGLSSFLELEFETCFAEFFMPTIRGEDKGSKKRYAGRQIFLEASVQDELVFKGLEAVRTDWTPMAREFQRELYRRIFFKEPFEQFIRDTVRAVYLGSCDEKLAYRKRIRRHLDDYKRNVPPHVQAARSAESKRHALGKPQRYTRGGWIRYFMTINGPEAEDCLESRLDYELYVERQLVPIVDAIVQFKGLSFDTIAGKQLGLF